MCRAGCCGALWICCSCHPGERGGSRAGFAAPGTGEGFHCRRAVDAGDPGAQAGSDRRERAEQGRSAVLARPQPAPGAGSWWRGRNDRRTRAQVSGEPLGEAGTLVAHRDCAETSARRLYCGGRRNLPCQRRRWLRLRRRGRRARRRRLPRLFHRHHPKAQ